MGPSLPFDGFVVANFEARTSVVSLVETLVQPLVRQDARLQDVCRDSVLRTPGIQTLAIQASTAEVKPAHLLRSGCSLRCTGLR